MFRIECRFESANPTKLTDTEQTDTGESLTIGLNQEQKRTIMAKILFASLVFGLLAVASFSYGADVADELGEQEEKFDESTVGLDLHNDYFYFNDALVSADYTRSKYKSIKVTMAGQRENLVKQTQKEATNPFAVAQTSSTGWGSLMDRWDYKQTKKGYQFFGLYHGAGRPFVVNKVRAHLLRRLANDVQDTLPFLDQAVEDPKLKENLEYLSDVKETVTHNINSVYSQIDQSITSSQLDNDDSLAAASVVIVTKHFVIVANSGDGRVLSYDDTSMLRDLTSEAAIVGRSAAGGQKKEFGANKSKSKGFVEPNLRFFERKFVPVEGEEAELQFLVVQTGPAARAVSAEQTKKIVLSQVQAHKHHVENEQDLHSGVVTNLLRTAVSKSAFSFVKNVDVSAMFIALETEYTNIH